MIVEKGSQVYKSPKKQKPCICGAGQKKSDNSKDSLKSSKKQASAWTAPPIDSKLDDAADRAAKRAQRDADRLEAACDDDRRFFEAHPGMASAAPDKNG